MAEFNASSQAAAAVIEQKAAGYDVLDNHGAAVTAYVAAHKINEGTYPSLAVLVNDIAKQVDRYDSLAKIPNRGRYQHAQRHVSCLRGHPASAQG